MIIIIKGTQWSYHHKKKVIKSLGHFRRDASCNKNMHVSLLMTCQWIRHEPWRLVEAEEWADRQRENVIGCRLRWVDLQVQYGMGWEITFSSLSDLLSLLLVPASSEPTGLSTPDHSYALTSLPVGPRTTKPASLQPPHCVLHHPSPFI